jgi:hypothetical protein
MEVDYFSQLWCWDRWKSKESMGVEAEPFASETIKMYHPGMYNSICEHVHPKNLVDEHVYIEISCTLKFQSGLERLQLILHGF